jgi:hypothetical protein
MGLAMPRLSADKKLESRLWLVQIETGEMAMSS